MKCWTLAIATMLILGTSHNPLQAEPSSGRRVLVDWSKIQAARPPVAEQAPAVVVKQRGPAAASMESRIKHVQPNINLYASCVDAQGVVHSSQWASYENCLAQTVGGRQVFVQDQSRGLILMMDLGRYHR